MRVKLSAAANGIPNNPYEAVIRMHSVWPDSCTLDTFHRVSDDSAAPYFPSDSQQAVMAHLKKRRSHLTDSAGLSVQPPPNKGSLGVSHADAGVAAFGVRVKATFRTRVPNKRENDGSRLYCSSG